MTERCGWCGSDPLYVAYHDSEWGVPERDPRALWEKLVLDGFQAGLSWITILRKREALRAQFDGFDPERVAGWTEENIENAMQNPAIIRHCGKIAGAVTSARLFIEIESRQGFAPFLWSFVDHAPIQNRWATLADVPAATAESKAMAAALKLQGFAFCGPVICYAFMQAVGMVNDHLTCCHRHQPVRALSAG